MKKALLFVITLLICRISAVQAQTPLWVQTNGPSGRWISAINFDSSGNVYVVADNLYRSANDGTTWQILPQRPIMLSTLPNGDLLGTFDSSMRISKDHGGSWNTILSFDTPMIANLNVMLVTPNVATVTISGGVFVQTPKGDFLRTTNEGVRWDTLPSAPFQGELYSFYNNTLFTIGGRYNDNINQQAYRSTDLGVSWTKIVNGQSIFYSMAGEPGGKLFATGGDLAQNEDLWSTDDGRSWTKSARGAGSFVAYVQNNPVAFYYNGLGIDVFDENNVYTHSISNGIFSIEQDAAGGFVTVMCGSPKGEVWASTGSILFKVNPASDASFTNVSLPTGSTKYLVAIGSGNVIASTGIPTGGSMGGNSYNINNTFLFNSKDAGASWQGIQGSDALSPLSLDSSHSMLAANTPITDANSFGTIVSSADEGATWVPLGPRLTNTAVTSIIVDLSGIIYMGCGEGVFRSTDKGSTWDQLNSGITNFQIQSLAVSQTGELFAGTSTAIFHSLNQALDWQALSFSPPDASGIVSLTINTSGEVLAAVRDAGIFWSRDDGLTWHSIGAGLSGNVNTMLSTPSGHVFAGTTTGAYYLPMGGGTWVNATAGLGTQSVLSITRDPNGTVYLGTDGAGVFRSTETYNSIQGASVEPPAPMASTLALGQVYPNPLQSSSTFSIAIPEASHVRVELLNILGEQMKLITDHSFKPGSYELGIDDRGLSDGVYYLMLNANGEVKVERVMIAR